MAPKTKWSMAKNSGKPTAKQKRPAVNDRTTSSNKDTGPSHDNAGSVNLDLQQRSLNIFRDAFKPGADDLSVLQEVKGHLYNRDFAAAFGKDDYLRVYASRWSPSRALAYLQVLDDIAAFLETCSDTDTDYESLRVVCVGGGAGGELVALSGWQSAAAETNVGNAMKLHALLVDIADWSSVTNALFNGITTAPELSRFASQAKRDDNRPLLSNDLFSTTFQRRDVLDMTTREDDLFTDAGLVTLMFTLNELYSTSMPKTQQLLAHLTTRMHPGACLLVVDSPGSYSTVSINGAEKKYPMHWLLDHTLLGQPTRGGEEAKASKWEKLISDDSRWFRLSQKLQYPIELENMRYQIHLYRRVEDVGG